jgi:hypothetical protein
MKKIFIIVSLLASNYAFAEADPEVYFGGDMSVNSGIVGQDTLYSQDDLPGPVTNKNPLNQDNYFAQDAELDVVTIGKTDNGVLYGGKATIELDSKMPRTISYDSTGKITYGDTSNTVYARRLYLFLEKDSVGRLEFGDMEGASKIMKFDASYRFGGTGGVAGNWWQYVNIPSFSLQYDQDKADGLASGYDVNDVRHASGKGNMSFIIRPDLPLAHGYSAVNGADKFDDTRTIARVSYFSPRISGVQVGASYALDSGYRGSSYYDNNMTPANSADAKDIIEGGINYIGQFNNVGLGISLTGEKGYAKSNEIINEDKFLQKDLAAYAAGLYFFVGNLSLSASYGSWENSLMWIKESLSKTDANYRSDNANYYSAALLYEFGPYKLGISHLSSEYREQLFNLTSYAFDYNLNKKLSLYTEINNYEFTTKKADIGNALGETQDNAGQVILIGARLKFGGTNNLSQFVLNTAEK